MLSHMARSSCVAAAISSRAAAARAGSASSAEATSKCRVSNCAAASPQATPSPASAARPAASSRSVTPCIAEATHATWLPAARAAATRVTALRIASGVPMATPPNLYTSSVMGSAGVYAALRRRSGSPVVG
jgi:hypothetical protein